VPFNLLAFLSLAFLRPFPVVFHFVPTSRRHSALLSFLFPRCSPYPAFSLPFDDDDDDDVVVHYFFYKRS
jgi:hypothetical protein